MRTITKKANTLLLALRYNYTPVSCYEIQNKVNPVVSVTLAHKQESYQLQFRVHSSLGSSSKMLSLRPLKTSKDCFLELPITTEETCPLLVITCITFCPEITLKWVTSKVEIAPSSVPHSATNYSNYPTTDPDFWPASANKIPATVDSWSHLRPAPSWISRM